MSWWHILFLLVFWQGIVWPLVRRRQRKRKAEERRMWHEQELAETEDDEETRELRKFDLTE